MKRRVGPVGENRFRSEATEHMPCGIEPGKRRKRRFRSAIASASAELSTASTDSHLDARCSANPPLEVKQSSALPRAYRAAAV